MDHQRRDRKPSVTRRDFLKGLGGGALGASLLPVLPIRRPEARGERRGNLWFIREKTITVTVNGTKLTRTVAPHTTLLEFLRDHLGLTGAKRICDRGECGGCTVLVEDRPIYSCLYLAVNADGARITTVEGLARGEQLHPVQAAFLEHDGYQCGYCTPGFIMAAVALLKREPNPDLEQIRQGLSGNLCRCGNYVRMYQAVQAAAQRMRRS